jgi:uncharacterized protein YabE (DUF348 family)
VFVLNTNSLQFRKIYILADDKLISVVYDKDKLLRDILKEQNIVLNPDDIIYNDLDKPVNPDARIKIIRVKKVKSKESKQYSSDCMEE